MNENQNLWQRFGSQIVLVVVAVLFLIGSRLQWSSGWLSGAGSLTAVTLATTPTPQPTSAAAEAPLLFDQPVPVVNDTSLSPLPNPRTFQAKQPNNQFETYEVQSGDTPNKIAEAKGITPETLLGGNPWLSQESSLLQTGSQLVILPVDGALHTVKPGETLESIAEQYNVSVDDIVGYASNNLEFPYRLFPDTQLLIPGAQVGSFFWTAPKSVAGSISSGGKTKWAVVGTGSFIWPVSGRCITTYYWYGHPGIDVSQSVGTPVYAADTGTVTYASWASGGYYDYGNLIVINHGNGYETFYAHLSGINVYAGQIVNQGQLIGATGNTGRSSGPHIHIEIRYNDFRDNPLNYLGGATQNCTGS